MNNYKYEIKFIFLYKNILCVIIISIMQPQCSNEQPDWNDYTRTKYDGCAQTLREHQSQLPGSYKTSEPCWRWCEPDQQYSQNMAEPAHWYRQIWNACSVDYDSKLRVGNVTNKRYINQHFTRPYVGSYHGAGQPTADFKDLETELRDGIAATHFKSCEPTAGITIDRFTPLPEFGNPQRVQHVVESWIRGGENTRDYVRKINYKKRLANKKNNKIINKTV